jgi:hypothetical protein
MVNLGFQQGTVGGRPSDPSVLRRRREFQIALVQSIDRLSQFGYGG